MLYSADQKGAFRVSVGHKPLDERLMGIIFRPDTWAANTVYSKPDENNWDVVIPAVFTGLYYKVKHPGKSGATEPAWVMLEGEETVDGTNGLVWEAVNYNLMPVTETIAPVSLSVPVPITYTATNGVTLSSTSNTATSCQFMIDKLPTAAIVAGEFEVKLSVIKSNGEVINPHLLFKVDNS